jgi:hypothetical protein
MGSNKVCRSPLRNKRPFRYFCVPRDAGWILAPGYGLFCGYFAVFNYKFLLVLNVTLRINAVYNKLYRICSDIYEHRRRQPRVSLKLRRFDNEPLGQFLTMQLYFSWYSLIAIRKYLSSALE